MDTVQDKVAAGVYESTIPYSRDREQRKARNQDYARLLKQFQADLAEEHGLTGHPKEERLYSIAYENGHSESLRRVADIYDELAELLK